MLLHDMVLFQPRNECLEEMEIRSGARFGAFCGLLTMGYAGHPEFGWSQPGCSRVSSHDSQGKGSIPEAWAFDHYLGPFGVFLLPALRTAGQGLV